MATAIQETANQAMVFSMQQLDNSKLAALEAMGPDHCPTIQEREWLEPLAAMSAPAFTPAPPEKLVGTILALSAALPKQATDELRGETMLAVYKRMLSDLTTVELEKAARKCLEELDWFPTIKQIRERSRGYLNMRWATQEQTLHRQIRNLLQRKPKPENPEDSANVDPDDVKQLVAEMALARSKRDAVDAP